VITPAIAVVLALLIVGAPPPEANRPCTILHDGVLDSSMLSNAEALGAEKWLQVNQDEQSYTSGVIDAEVMLRDVGMRTSLQPPPWAMLDFETPFFENLGKPVGSPEREASIRTMKTALAAAKRRYPGTKWSFYGLPNLSFWVDGAGWAALDAPRREAAIIAAIEACRDVLAEADWISVSAYDYYDPRMVVPGRTDSIRGTPQGAIENGIAWRKAQVAAALRLAAGRPVIPTVCPYWVPGGVAPTCRLISAEDFVGRQVVPCLDAGATGVAIWTGYGYRIDQVQSTEPEPLRVERGFGRDAWRSAFVADFLAGAVPRDWADAELRRKLIARASSTMLDRITAIRRLGAERRQGP
jgi:hypothetical protein